MPAVHAAGTVPYLLWFPQSSAPADGFTLVRPREMESEQRTQSRDPIAAPSHIIERPRLIKLMEESGARVIVLNAPAGYGKTTLARQWRENERRHAVWYRCTSSSADVAALARSMAELLDKTPGELTASVVQRIAVSTSPESDARTLAEMFIERPSPVDPDVWLVLDDYHHINGSRGAEAFLHDLIEGLEARVIITSRVRPSWVMPRQIVYGEVLEIDRTLLAMTEAEAREALALGLDESEALIEYARGWPAVIGLAASVPANRHLSVVPPTLLEFLADEVFASLEGEVQEALLCLSLSPSGSEQDAAALVGADGAQAIEAAVSAGCFSPATPASSQLHPLLHAFLRAKLRTSATTLEAAARRLIDLYVGQRRWDDAFFVATEAASADLAVEILDKAFDQLLGEGRIATLATWIHSLEGHEPARPLLDLVAAELAFREGLHAKSQRLAIEASRGFDDAHLRKPQALIRAGQAAGQADDGAAARELFVQAGMVARTRHDRREALLGELFAALELESPDLGELEARVRELPSDDLDTDIRRQSALLVVALRTGGLFAAVERADSYSGLIDRIRDPFARAAFTNALAHACNASGRYRTALSLTRTQTKFSQKSSLHFAVPHTLHAEAMALLGLNRPDRAWRTIGALSERAVATHDVHFRLNTSVLRARHMLVTGQPEAAIAELSPPPDDRASAGLRAEYLATRALALFAAGRAAPCLEAASEAASVTRWLAESAVLVSFVEAANDVRSGGDAVNAAHRVIELVASTGHVDAFVVATRTIRDVAERLIDASSGGLLERAFARMEAPGDLDFGVQAPAVSSRVPLSRRELDVYELLCRGMSNREIAAQLFLSEKTVKVHLRHIYDKLGVRTRTRAALLSQSVLGMTDAS